MSHLPAIGLNTAALWYVHYDIGLTPPFLACCERLLSAQECERAERFACPDARIQYVLGRGLVRSVLSHYSSILPGEWQFTTNAHGKPLLAAHYAVALDFNIAHCKGLVICGVTSGRAIGVDCESLARKVNHEELAQRVLTPDEGDYLRGVPSPRRAEAFLDLWCLKEAVVKCHGAGLSLPLQGFSVCLPTGQDAQVTFLTANNHGAVTWQLKQLRLGSGYTAAVVLQHSTNQHVNIEVQCAKSLW